MHKYILSVAMAISILACRKEATISLPSSAQANVTVLEQRFAMANLGRDRQIRVYLPKGYVNSEKSYPVLYMHDGQNLFDDSTSYGEEWGIDESLNQLSASSSLEMLVVGIDNGQEKRWSELSPWENAEYGKAEGSEYMRFIVEQIKPYIDSTYRTLPTSENTAIMGSSMGGLISHYAICKYPDVFGRVGIFSPSYWYADEVYEYVRKNPIPKDSKLYLVVGKKEGEMADASQKMYDIVLETGHPKDKVILLIDSDGEHNEASWRNQFIPAIIWLFK